ncbi:MAG: hypothetical protein DWQ37_10165 [Planctomycetota bacterium]|nr:MAG: hypothetical protein DWQ37_10165 [Planctomycetota bacterium]
MAGRLTLIAVITAVCVHCAVTSWAQEDPTQRPTLADRLQRFRQELLGDTSPEPQPRRRTTAQPAGPRATRKALGRRQQSTIMAPGNRQPHRTEVQYGPTPGHPTPAQPTPGRPTYAQPGNLQSQSARRARPESDEGPMTVYPSRSREPGGHSAMRRPVEEARRRPIEPLEPQEVQPYENDTERYEPAGEYADDTYEPVSPANEEHYEPEADEDAGWVPYREDDEVNSSTDADASPFAEADAADEQQPSTGPQVFSPARRARAAHNALRDDAGSMPEPEENAEENFDDSEAGPEIDAPAADNETLEVEVPAPDEPTPASPTPAEGSDEPTPAEPTPGEPASLEPVEADPADDAAEGVLLSAASPVIAVQATGPRSVLVGKEAEFVVKASNTGAPAKNVAISIHIPSYADVADARPTSGSAQPTSPGEARQGVVWTLDTLDAEAEETLVLKLVPRRSSPLDLALSYTFAPETSQTMVEVQEPKLAMTLSGPSEVPFGETRIYKLTISNPGNGDTHNVRVSLLPIGRAGDAPASHRLGTLLAGESKTIDIELTARQAGPLAIKAQSFADGGLRAEAAEQVLVRRADLAVEIEAPQMKYAGTPGTCLVKIANTGDAVAQGVRVTAVLPLDAKFLAASSGGRLDTQSGQVHWTLGALPAGGERVMELQFSMNTAGDNRVQVSATAQGDLSAAASSNTRVEAIADLKLEVRDPQGPVAVGDDAVYEIRIRNRGTKAARDIDLAVFFSEGLEPTVADGGGHEMGSGQVIFHPIASIEAGEAATFHVRAQAAKSGNHVFRAEVVCESLNTKLAAEEATHFYGDGPRASAAYDDQPAGQPTPAAPPDDLVEPSAYDSDPAPLAPGPFGTE